MITAEVFRAMQREIYKLRRELAVKQAVIDRLCQLPSLLPPEPKDTSYARKSR